MKRKTLEHGEFPVIARPQPSFWRIGMAGLIGLALLVGATSYRVTLLSGAEGPARREGGSIPVKLERAEAGGVPFEEIK